MEAKENTRLRKYMINSHHTPQVTGGHAHLSPRQSRSGDEYTLPHHPTHHLDQLAANRPHPTHHLSQPGAGADLTPYHQ